MEKQGWTWRAWMLYSALLVVVLNPPLHLSTGPAWPAHGCIRRAQVIPDYLAPIRVSLLLDCRYCSIGGAALSAMQAVVQRLSSAGGARAASSRWLATAARPVARSPLNMPADMAPSKVGPKWRRPRVSRRKAATMRKAALVNGTYGSWDAATGALRGGSYSAAPRTSCATPLTTGTGWDPAWDPTPMAGVARPPKGRRHEKAKPERCVVGRGFETAGPEHAHAPLLTASPRSRLPWQRWTRRSQTTKRCVPRLATARLSVACATYLAHWRRAALLACGKTRWWHCCPRKTRGSADGCCTHWRRRLSARHGL